MTNSSLSPEEHAQRVLQRAGIIKLPVSIRNIARLYDVKVVEEQLEPGASGYLIRERGHALIVVAQDESTQRQRFTIAHELGHLLMHRGRPLLVDGDVQVNERRMPVQDFATPREEREANQFAAEVLMPEKLVVDMVRRVPLGQDVVKYVAKGCEVSIPAAQYRLTNLGLLMPPDQPMPRTRKVRVAKNLQKMRAS